MENEDTRALSAIGGLIIDLLARQMALLSLLRSTPGFTEEAYRKALVQAQGELNRISSVATLRSQASAQRLEELEKILRGMGLPK